MININILTYNCGAENINAANINDINANFEFHIRELLKHSNILFISLQEDTEEGSIFTDVVKNNLSDYNYIVNKTGIPGFYVRNIIIYSKTLHLVLENVNIIKHNIKGSKNSIVCKININNLNIYLIASHINIDTKDTEYLNLGYEERKKVLTELINSLELNYNTCAIIGGDLNFRINTKNEEQLDLFIQEYNKTHDIKIKDLTNIQSIGPTCKINPVTKHECTDIHNKGPRLLYNEYECNAECKSINKQHHIKCYSQLNKRIPSYCDRVLCFYNNDFAKKYVVKSLNTKTILDKFSIHSDHNPVSVSIVIQDIFYSKYIKYKHKYLLQMSFRKIDNKSFNII
jgi:hypothetical protein